MKPNKVNIYTYVFFLLIFCYSTHAQIDSKKKNLVIPAVETENDTLDGSPLVPPKTVKSDGDFSGFNLPKPNVNLKMPKKELSMFKEEFGNPGELFADRLENQQKSIIKELELGTKGSKVDVFFGNHKTKSKTVKVMYRDYGLEDGDLVRISVNDEIIIFRAALLNSFGSFELKLRPGVNKIEFLALNEGYALPNTAHFRVLDDKNNIIAADLWALSVNVKGTVNIIKEE
ncbi:hypothetical protein [Seonamhaeicola sp. ML3]|uniref:hypothetical protein n=1 Tax=Seonamhaeicola sp. ML3 TaxID=2937786 RepID=UPI00200FC1A1|nr:hypothetical protein [Seonamhaeicola sp. ML3]